MCEARVRTSAPFFPSGGRLASTSHSGGSISKPEMPRMVCLASLVATSSICDSAISPPFAWSATKITSTSLT